jgi:hypothetical protein
VDQQATRRRPIQSGPNIYSGRLKGSRGVTPFLKATEGGSRAIRQCLGICPLLFLSVGGHLA